MLLFRALLNRDPICNMASLGYAEIIASFYPNALLACDGGVLVLASCAFSQV